MPTWTANSRRAFLLALFLSSTLAAAQSITSATLSSALSSDSATAIQGQALKLPPFDCTFLSNASHAVVSFNVSKPIAEVGYVAIGFGKAMADSAMVILYPSDNGNWTLSLRESQGHDDPEQKTSSTAESPLVLLPALISSSAESTLVSFIRPLSLPSSQTFFKHDTYLNLSRSSGQAIIYAFSGSRPGAGGQIEQHGGGEFGSATVNLGLVFDASKGSARPDWTRYDTVILVHGAIAMITWLLVSPVAILIGRLGRRWGKWYNFHSSIQAFVTFPLTIATVVLGILAANWGPQSGWGFHKGFGFLLLIAIVAQGIFGWWSHLKLNPDRLSRPWRNSIHLILGIPWIQIFTGFTEYTSRPLPRSLRIIFYTLLLATLLTYLSSIVLLVISRKCEGRSWGNSIFGLGRDGASGREHEGMGEGGREYVPDDPVSPKGQWMALGKQGGEGAR